MAEDTPTTTDPTAPLQYEGHGIVVLVASAIRSYQQDALRRGVYGDPMELASYLYRENLLASMVTVSITKTPVPEKFTNLGRIADPFTQDEKDLPEAFTDDPRLPNHLRSDGVSSQCSACRRTTYSLAELGQRCGMRQPNGGNCPGIFPYPRGTKFPAGTGTCMVLYVENDNVLMYRIATPDGGEDLVTHGFITEQLTRGAEDPTLRVEPSPTVE